MGAVYMLRSYQLSMFGPPKLTSFQDLTWNETAVFVVLSISILIIGLFSAYIIDYTAPAIRVLTAITPFNQLIIE